MIKKVIMPIEEETIDQLRAGDMVEIYGKIYTGRDAAHKRLTQMLREGAPLPVDLKGQVIYYVGPCPAKPGQIIGSCGPTTSFRMDAYTPELLDHGLKGMIGKGARSEEVICSIKKNKAVYFAAIGGAGATIARCVKKAEIAAYSDLGPEAIYCLYVEGLPCIVAIDCLGNDLYLLGPEQYRI